MQNKSLIISEKITTTIRKELCQLHINIIDFPTNTSMQSKLNYHTDLQLCKIAKDTIIINRSIESNSYFVKNLTKVDKDIKLIPTNKEVGNIYPDDCIINCCVLNDKVICKANSTDSTITSFFPQDKIINTKQGYCKCSIAIVNSNAIMTADLGIINAIKKSQYCNEIEILQLSDNCVLLDGFSSGFIGGACFKLSNDILAFTGKIEAHADYDNIKSFCNNYNVQPYSLSNDKLYDYGGSIQLY